MMETSLSSLSLSLFLTRFNSSSRIFERDIIVVLVNIDNVFIHYYLHHDRIMRRSQFIAWLVLRTTASPTRM